MVGVHAVRQLFKRIQKKHFQKEIYYESSTSTLVYYYYYLIYCIWNSQIQLTSK